MTNSPSVAEEHAGPVERLMEMHLMGGPWICQTLYVAANLGLADHIGDGVVAVRDLAVACGADERVLHRFCRALVGLGVLSAGPGRSFGLTELGRVLRTDADRTLRWGAMLHGGATFRAWADVMHTVRTGEPAFEHVFGMTFFEHLTRDPESNEAFNRTMGVTDRPPAVLAEFGFPDRGVVADIGGGIGTLLAGVLRDNPGLRGVLLDLPDAVAEAPEHLAEQGVAERCRIVGASFFETIPPDADVYVLSRVLHNWDDDRAVELLSGIRAAMPAHGRLLVVDHLIPEDAFPAALLADLHMMIVLGGADRTEAELRELLARGGFTVDRVWAGTGDAGPRVDSMVAASPAP